MVNHDDGWLVIRQSALSFPPPCGAAALCRDRLTDTASCGVIRLADESNDSDDNGAGLLTIVVTGEHKVCNSLNKIRKENQIKGCSMI